MDDLIKIKHLLNPNAMNKLHLSMKIDDKPQFFSNPIKHNQSSTEPSANINVYDKVQLICDPRNLIINNTHNKTHQKPPPSRKKYDLKKYRADRAAQCAK